MNAYLHEVKIIVKSQPLAVLSTKNQKYPPTLRLPAFQSERKFHLAKKTQIVSARQIRNINSLICAYICMYMYVYIYFLQNSLKIIEDLNRNHTKSVNSAVYGLTVFSDLSQIEFAKIFLRQNNSSHGKTYPEGNNVALGEFKRKSKRSPAVPLKVDWRTRGIIGPVHNQRTCGACWAFSTIETIEAMNALKSGDLVELSVQEVFISFLKSNRT